MEKEIMERISNVNEEEKIDFMELVREDEELSKILGF